MKEEEKYFLDEEGFQIRPNEILNDTLEALNCIKPSERREKTRTLAQDIEKSAIQCEALTRAIYDKEQECEELEQTIYLKLTKVEGKGYKVERYRPEESKKND
jgi:hypothetical protein